MVPIELAQPCLIFRLSHNKLERKCSLFSTSSLTASLVINPNAELSPVPILIGGHLVQTQPRQKCSGAPPPPLLKVTKGPFRGSQPISRLSADPLLPPTSHGVYVPSGGKLQERKCAQNTFCYDGLNESRAVWPSAPSLHSLHLISHCKS